MAVLKSVQCIVLTLVINVIFNKIVLIGAQSEGQPCTLPNSRAGTCKLLTSCPTAQGAIRQGTPPTLCQGNQGTIPVVCCSDSAQASPGASDSGRPQGGGGGKSECESLQPLQDTEDKARDKCVEYSHLVCEWITPPTLNPGNAKVPVNRCGHTVVPLIVGGTKAQVREFPHMARLGYGSEPNIIWACGGTLISDEFVLTAGHCLQDRNVGKVNFVRLGDTDFSTTSDDNSLQQFSVAERLPHPEYKTNSKYYDVALLKLDRKVQLNKDVIPACLPLSDTIDHNRAIATGWGHTEYDGHPSDALQKVVLEFFSDSVCNDTFKINRELRQGIRPSIQVCAGSKTEEMDTCQGDSGGPLQLYRTVPYCMYDVIGVTSFGSACGVPGRPAVYARVAPARAWIVDTVWP